MTDDEYTQKLIDHGRELWEKEKEEEARLNLKPCPFCGSKARLIGNTGGNYFHVACQDLEYKCNIALSDWHTEQEAVEQWNKRV